ncbi:MAG TPA: polysaccharide biosynthesis protein [Nostoc sp.]|uniref:polysaccharide biosynthesis protein n=1 Tax=Nostoc sp. TaxID=1180 RepID=UPI002D48A006|nr:polysaccharide biosynthesis protein [Nostoc sp.]HYX18486.1 polysaccharide biosynthesis protein [Nostoc sp.]
MQLVVQALGFASGILIVRTLNKTEYSYFLIANAIQSTIDLMSDFGITIALNSIGGQVWKDTDKFSQLISTAFFIRRYLIIISTIVISPLLFFLLSNNGASLNTSIFLILTILLELQFYSTNKILGVVPRLYSEINQIQRLDLITSFTRLIGILVAYLLGMNAVTAACCSTLASGVHSFFLSRWVVNIITPNSPVSSDYKLKIWSLIKTQFLTTTFYSFQGQITIWLISIFGKNTTIAEVGALSRLGVILTIINPVINSIIVPSYARCHSIKLLQKRYWQLVLIFLIVSGCLLLLFTNLSQQFIWILGSQYAHLNNEIVLIMTSSLITSLTTMIWSLNYAKAWVNESWLIIPSTIMTQMLLLLVLDISTVRGIILFSLFSAIPPLVVNLYMSNKGIKMLSKA